MYRIKTVVDVSKPFSLDTLTTGQKLQASFSQLVNESTFVKRKKTLEKDKEIKKREEEILAAVSDISQLAYGQLQFNTISSQVGERTKLVEIILPGRYRKNLKEILSRPELNFLDVSVVELDSDILESFGEEVSIILSIKKKVLD